MNDCEHMCKYMLAHKHIYTYAACTHTYRKYSQMCKYREKELTNTHINSICLHTHTHKHTFAHTELTNICVHPMCLHTHKRTNTHTYRHKNVHNTPHALSQTFKKEQFYYCAVITTIHLLKLCPVNNERSKCFVCLSGIPFNIGPSLAPDGAT